MTCVDWIGFACLAVLLVTLGITIRKLILSELKLRDMEDIEDAVDSRRLVESREQIDARREALRKHDFMGDE